MAALMPTSTAPQPGSSRQHGASRRVLLLLVCASAGLAVWAPREAGAAGASSTAVPAPTRGIVDHVADGDTFTLRNGQRVRIIGIDSPEEYFGKHDCGSKPAAALLRRLLPAGTPVTLRRDAIQSTRDRYGRLLRYVATGHQPDIGLTMIRSGWAGAYIPTARATPARPATASPRTPRGPPIAAAGRAATRSRRRTPTQAGGPRDIKIPLDAGLAISIWRT